MVGVRATDDYAAVVSWGEIDPALATWPVLLAVGQNHQPLDRPRLVVPRDVKGRRYVSDVVEVPVARIG